MDLSGTWELNNCKQDSDAGADDADLFADFEDEDIA